MLLGEYLWLAYCASLPLGVEPDPVMSRERKQVSSHIQVLKNIFKNHRCCRPFPFLVASATPLFLFTRHFLCSPCPSPPLHSLRNSGVFCVVHGDKTNWLTNRLPCAIPSVQATSSSPRK